MSSVKLKKEANENLAVIMQISKSDSTTAVKEALKLLRTVMEETQKGNSVQLGVPPVEYKSYEFCDTIKCDRKGCDECGAKVFHEYLELAGYKITRLSGASKQEIKTDEE